MWMNMLLSSGAEETAASPLSGIMSFLPFIAIIAIFYFLMIRPQKKREAANQDMRSKLEVGDEIITVGGIVGRVVRVQDDTLVIETTSDRTKIRLAKWAIQTNNTAAEKAEAQRALDNANKKKKKKKDEME